MAIHSSILAWRILQTEEPGRLQMHRVATSWILFTFMHWRRKWQPTLVFLPGESQGQRSLVGCSPWGRTESDTTEQLHFHFHVLEKEMQPTPVFLPGESQGRGSLVGCRLWVAQSRTRLKRLSSSSSALVLENDGDQNNTMLSHCVVMAVL